MDAAQENDKEREERMANARVGYQVAASLEANEVRALWSRFSAMLTANSIAIAVIGCSLNSVITKRCSILILLPIVMSVFGLFLCREWYFLIARKQKYCMYLMLSARELERKHLYPVVRTLNRGARLVGEIACRKGQEPKSEKFEPEQIRIEVGNRIISVKLDGSERHKTSMVARKVIKGFGVLYIFLFLYGFFIALIALKQFIGNVVLNTPAVEIAVIRLCKNPLIVSGLLLAVVVSRAWIRSRRSGQQKS